MELCKRDAEASMDRPKAGPSGSGRPGNAKPKEMRSCDWPLLLLGLRVTGRRVARRPPANSVSSVTLPGRGRMERDPRFREQLPSKHFSPAPLHALPSSAGWAGVAHDPDRHHSSRQMSCRKQQRQASCRRRFMRIRACIGARTGRLRRLLSPGNSALSPSLNCLH